MDPASAARVVMYTVAHAGGHDVIVRTHADDARSFYGALADNENDDIHPVHTPPQVLVADASWEGKDLSGPSAVQVGGAVWLYYAAAGGVGLAQSDDGITFAKFGQPVLGIDANVVWETTPPAAPSVAVLPDGTWRMMYSAGNAIGEARSTDGFVWTRMDADPSTPGVDPVLGPSPSVEMPVQPFDRGQVSDPLLAPRITPGGRLQLRVLYTGWNMPPGAQGRSSAIGFAARYGESGPLSRQPAPVYSVSLHEAAPALFEWNEGSMLYVHEDATALDPMNPFPAIAAAFAPEDDALPPASAFPSSP